MGRPLEIVSKRGVAFSSNCCRPNHYAWIIKCKGRNARGLVGNGCSGGFFDGKLVPTLQNTTELDRVANKEGDGGKVAAVGGDSTIAIHNPRYVRGHLPAPVTGLCNSDLCTTATVAREWSTKRQLLLTCKRRNKAQSRMAGL